MVTTMKAGMAFADWPSSDGRNMILYPWFRDFRAHPEKFAEHGHRLAGLLAGISSVALLIAAWVRGGAVERRFAGWILAGVILQGLIGGARVVLNQQAVGLLHSVTASLYLAMCAVFWMRLSPNWQTWLAYRRQLPVVSVVVLLCAPAVVLLQNIMGAFLRHLHLLQREHVMGAGLTGVLIVVCVHGGVRSGHLLLQRLAHAAGGLISLQLTLGLASYASRFGIPAEGLVAVDGGSVTSVIRSLHTVAGICVFAVVTMLSFATTALLRSGAIQLAQSDELSPLATGKGAVQ
jgi:cytochrome c oxidase assembly protein subunit 15